MKWTRKIQLLLMEFESKCGLGFILDLEENPVMPLRLDLHLSLGLFHVKYLVRPRHIDLTFSSVRRLCDGPSFHRFHGEICATFELQQILHTTEVRHVIPNCHTVHFSCKMTPLTACLADLLSYAGLVLCIVLTPSSLSISPTHRLNGTIELSPSVPMVPWSLSQ